MFSVEKKKAGYAHKQVSGYKDPEGEQTLQSKVAITVWKPSMVPNPGVPGRAGLLLFSEPCCYKVTEHAPSLD